MHGKINLPRSQCLMSILRCTWLLVRNTPSKDDLHTRQATTMHASYLYTNRFKIKTYTNQTIRSSWIGTEKKISLLLWMSQLTKIWDWPLLCEPNPGLLFNCPPTTLLCISFGTRKAKGLGQWEYTNGQSFFAIFFLFQIGPLALLL